MHYERYPIASPWIIPHPRHLLPLEKPAQLRGLLLWEQDERHEGEPEAEERRGSDRESWKKEECPYICARARAYIVPQGYCRSPLAILRDARTVHTTSRRKEGGRLFYARNSGIMIIERNTIWPNLG
ncbi:uncharacterized protein LOC116185337 [Apis dorsata]|uniref:uncharacterized protein LOC116185337 n=1 Tax=Apis dorsata TaxID=7462 RepID=UPI001293B58F|nr:uncharacterized protein LOC116185337 [Apis dorsata]